MAPTMLGLASGGTQSTRHKGLRGFAACYSLASESTEWYTARIHKGAPSLVLVAKHVPSCAMLGLWEYKGVRGRDTRARGRGYAIRYPSRRYPGSGSESSESSES